MENFETRMQTSRAAMRIWPTYLARVVAIAIFIGGPLVIRKTPVPGITEQSWFFLYGISGWAALVIGAIVMHLGEWLVNAHRDSVETKSRFNFGLMLLTAGLLVVGLATLVSQWHNNAS